MSKHLKLLGVALFFLLNGLLSQQSPTTQSYSSDLLRLAKAAQIKAYLNEEQQPCNDFYNFACGKWPRVQPATKSHTKTTYLHQLQDLYVRKSAELLKGENNDALDRSVGAKLRAFAESCRNKSDALELNMEPILNVVNFRGGWPNISSETWYEYEYDWLRVIAELRSKLGVDIIVGLEVIPDFEDKDMHRIKVGAPKLNLGTKDAYLSNDYTERRVQYKQNIADKLQQYFSYKPEQWALEVAGQVLDVEQQLAKGLPDNAELTLKQTTRQRSAAELKSAYGSYVDLSRYLNLIFNQTIYVPVYETPADYMSNLVEVIKQTPKLTIANYTMWRVLEMFEVSAGEFKRHNQPDNWCVHQVMAYFPHQLESMFDNNYNSMQMINELQSVWADIKRTFREELQDSTQLNWITLETRQKAVFKLDAMELEIVKHDVQNFEEQMHSLVLHSAQYSQNLINILQWQTQHQLVKLIEKPTQSSESDIKLPKYRHVTNRIQIPITFQQARFFWDATYPNALKYGTLGFMLAHEMMHGFDAIGRKYDKHGYQRGWWDTVSEFAFDERANCLTKQHENRKYQDKLIDDPDMLTTSIADNGGLAVAYRAYQKWSQNVATEELAKETLPLLSYTKNQLFYIGFAQLWCADYDESIEKFTELPERERVVGALNNFNEFPNDFECKRDSLMNPARKCKIF